MSDQKKDENVCTECEKFLGDTYHVVCGKPLCGECFVHNMDEETRAALTPGT